MKSKNSETKTVAKKENKKAVTKLTYKNNDGKEVVVTKGTLTGITNKINKKFDNVKNTYFEIGQELSKIYKNDLWKVGGYINFSAYVEKNFNLKKSTAYRYVEIYDKFGKYEKQYREYSYSQMLEIITVDCEYIDKFNAKMTIKQMRELKKDIQTIKEQKELEKQLNGEYAEDEEQKELNVETVEELASVDGEKINYDDDDIIEIKGIKYIKLELYTQLLK